MSNLELNYKNIILDYIDIRTREVLENIGLKYIDITNEEMLTKLRKGNTTYVSNEKMLKENDNWKFIHFIKTKDLKEIFDDLEKIDTNYFGDIINKYNDFIEDGEETEGHRYFIGEITKYGKDNKLITFNDYLDIKEHELKLYSNHSVQDLWFNIQEEVGGEGHPFLEEIEKSKLEEKFSNGSDYCDKDLANKIIQKLKRIQNKKLNKIGL